MYAYDKKNRFSLFLYLSEEIFGGSSTFTHKLIAEIYFQ